MKNQIFKHKVKDKVLAAKYIEQYIKLDYPMTSNKKACLYKNAFLNCLFNQYSLTSALNMLAKNDEWILAKEQSDSNTKDINDERHKIH